jgi:hypothetical protein
MGGVASGTVHFDASDLTFMPHKYNADRRHHSLRPKRRVTNWAAYIEALRQRGSLRVCLQTSGADLLGGKAHVTLPPCSASHSA